MNDEDVKKKLLEFVLGNNSSAEIVFGKHRVFQQTNIIVPHERLKTDFNLAQIMESCRKTHEDLKQEKVVVKSNSANSFYLGDYLIIFRDNEHPDFWGVPINGYAIHEKKEAVIKVQDWVRVMAVIGHEIGHISTPLYSNLVREEAKAYAFSYAWTKSISNKHPELMKDYEAEFYCPTFYSFEEIENLMAHDAGYEIHNNPFKNSDDWKKRCDMPIHEAVRNLVASELKKGISAMEIYQMIVEDKIPIPAIAQTGIIGITRDIFYSKEKSK